MPDACTRESMVPTLMCSGPGRPNFAMRSTSWSSKARLASNSSNVVTSGNMIDNSRPADARNKGDTTLERTHNDNDGAMLTQL